MRYVLALLVFAAMPVMAQGFQLDQSLREFQAQRGMAMVRDLAAGRGGAVLTAEAIFCRDLEGGLFILGTSLTASDASEEHWEVLRGEAGGFAMQLMARKGVRASRDELRHEVAILLDSRLCREALAERLVEAEDLLRIDTLNGASRLSELAR